MKAKAACLLLAIIGSLMFLSGCGTWGKLVDATAGRWIGAAGRLKETVAILPFTNRMPWVANRLQTDFRSDLIHVLQKHHSRILLVLPGDKQYPDGLNRFIPAAGKAPDNIGMATLCQQTGLNDVITGQLLNVTLSNQKGGMLWWKHPHPTAKIELEVVMYHAASAAKLLDRTFFLDVALSDADVAALKQNQMLTASAAAEPLKDLAGDVAKQIRNRLEELPWEGSIRSVSANKATLPFGKRAGLAVGDVLEVQNQGDLMVAQNGSKYILPGLKVGRIRISAVTPYTAKAVILGKGARMAIGDVARFPADR